MADQIVSQGMLMPVTEDAFLADRRRFWTRFTGFTAGSMVAVALAVLLTLYFIL